MDKLGKILCGRCGEMVRNHQEMPHCAGKCASFFHYDCSEREAKWRKKSSEDKAAWICDRCKPGASTDPLSQILAKLEDIAVIKTAVSKIDSELEALKNSIVFIHKEYEELKEENKTIKKALSEVETKTEKLLEDGRKKDEEITVLKHMINDMEQYGRRDNVEIHGIDKTDNESVKDIVQTVADKLGVNMKKDDIIAAHRLPSRSINLPQPIIAKLGRAIADEFLSKRKSKLRSNDIIDNGSYNKIYINENLTQYNKKLLYLTKIEAKKLNFKYVWTRGGQILVRKEENARVIRIKTAADISNKLTINSQANLP